MMQKGTIMPQETCLMQLFRMKVMQISKSIVKKNNTTVWENRYRQRSSKIRKTSVSDKS